MPWLRRNSNAPVLRSGRRCAAVLDLLLEPPPNLLTLIVITMGNHKEGLDVKKNALEEAAPN